MTTPFAAFLARPSARAWTTGPAPELLDFHRSIPGYAPTRLVELPPLARELGASRVWVKEESSRYGLPAFKMLGAAHAVARALSARLGVTDRPLPFDELTGRIAGTGVREIVAATDGNHGRAVAHCAALVGLPSRIFLPRGVSEQAIDGIRSEAAEVTVLDRPYDEVVAHAAGKGPLPQDAHEILEQLLDGLPADTCRLRAAALDALPGISAAPLTAEQHATTSQEGGTR